MRKFSNANQVKNETDLYVDHFTGSPLVIGIDSIDDYLVLLDSLRDDPNKQIKCVSEQCEVEFPPNPAFHISMISEMASEKPVVWIGAIQASMLYGQEATEDFLINILGFSFNGPVIVLCPYCCTMLETIGKKYGKLGYNITLIENTKSVLPSIYINKEESAVVTGKPVKGIKELLQMLEEGKYPTEINVVTTCDFSHLAEPIYPIYSGLTPYQALCKIEPLISINTDKNNGTTEQWQKLLLELKKAGNLSSLCESSLCSIQSLANEFGGHFSADADARFLCFICLKAFCSKNNDYLAYCLEKAEKVDEFEKELVNAILDIDYNDKKFSRWIHQRRRILDSFDENSALIKDYCVRAAIKGKEILWYISDRTEDEQAAIIHALCCYSYTSEELNTVLKEISPQLHAYIQPFVFDEFNTKLIDTNVHIRAFLTDYFQRYKLQKLTNRIDPDFIQIVEKESMDRSYTNLQTRSTIVKKLDKTDAQPYFVDALGVEFLPFIQAKAKEYEMQFECFVGQCNLPSITSTNKEFYNFFPEGGILKEDELDKIKHQGIKYDFNVTKEPLHIFEELKVLDRDLRKMKSALVLNQCKCKRIIIISDHGTSRLAVIYQSENGKLELSESGKHSGRCCPISEDPHIPFAAYEGGFAILADYERFKGSRKADVEAHGGATLEEVVVPVIVLTLKPKARQIFFKDSIVPCSPKDGSSIVLFSDPPLEIPRMVIGEYSYQGRFDGDKHNVIFEMTDIRRKGHHEAAIFDGGQNITTLTFETKRMTGENPLI